MKRFTIILFSLLVHTILFAQPQKIELRLLDGYHANNKLKLEKGVNFLVFSKQRDFERFFGKIEKEDMPNFDFEHVLVMLTPPTREQYYLAFNTTGSKAGNFIEVYCTINKDKHTLPYIDHPISIVAIPKYFIVNRVDFYSDQKKKKLLKSIKVSPK